MSFDIDLDDGPHLAAAVLCEKALEEKDNVHSLIRLVDRITVTTASAGAMPEIQTGLLLFLGFRSGSAKGNYEATVVFVDPDGKELTKINIPFFAEGEERGNNIRVNLNELKIQKPGLFWFNVFLAGQLLTRVPLRVIHLRTGAS